VSKESEPSKTEIVKPNEIPPEKPTTAEIVKSNEIPSDKTITTTTATPAKGGFFDRVKTSLTWNSNEPI